jgi:subtilisin family serine protease
LDPVETAIGLSPEEDKNSSSNRHLLDPRVQSDNVPSGLDRIDQFSTPLDGAYTYDWDGSGVTVFILDSGIRTTHVEFEGRATCGFDFFNPNVTSPDRCRDVYSHGTHVAGIVAGRTDGVAKNANVVAVKVMDDNGDGSDSSVLAGMDYVLQQKQEHPDTPMVVNMSFLGALDSRFNKAVARLVNAGIVVVAAVGNYRKNACLFSPGSSRKVLTVGATMYNAKLQRDRATNFSNYGSCVDIYAYVCDGAPTMRV